MAAKTLHELEIEVEKIKTEFSLLISVLRRDVDALMKIPKPSEPILKPDSNAGKNID